MIRDVVIHLLGEQPVLADLLEDPAAADVNLICTNLRTVDGRRPVFVDHTASTFVFPYHQVRFIEIRLGRAATAGPGGGSPGVEAAREAPAPEVDLEIDEDFLRRVRDA